MPGLSPTGFPVRSWREAIWSKHPLTLVSVSLSLGLACFLREESFTLLTDVGGGEASSSAAELSVTACFHLGTSALDWCRFLENKQVLSDQQLQRAAVLSLKTGRGNVRWQEGP